MDIVWKKELTKTSYQLMREAGYVPITDRQSGKQSYVFKITANKYPRFHVYVEDETENSLQLHVHLDQREHGFGEKLHDTDYKGEEVQAEAKRIERWLQHFTVKKSGEEKEDKEEERGFLNKLFG